MSQLRKKGGFLMSKIRINKNILNKGKYALIAIPMVATIALSGCSFFPDGDRARYSNAVSYSNTSDYTVSNDYAEDNKIDSEFNFDDLNIPLKDIGNVDLSKMRVAYTNSQNSNFISYLNKVDVIYDYENI